MAVSSDYVLHLIALKRAEMVDRLQQQGFDVTAEAAIGGQSVDLIARKDDRKTAYQFVVAEQLREKSADIQARRAVVAEHGFEFRLVIVKPPKTPTIEVDSLDRILFDAIVHQGWSGDLDSLATRVQVEGISDIEVSGVDVAKDKIDISGEATVDVQLEYGGGEARDCLTLDDSYPFSFSITLDNTLTLLEVHELVVDTSSFHG